MSSRSDPATPVPPALAAFLRGVERRGAVLAELQAGDAVAGDAAVASAMRHFRGIAAAAPLSEWPARFWSLLLAQPQLRTRTEVALAIDATDRLAELGPGPRAALLLRLAAGLDSATAAAALGVAEGSYRLALQRALPHHADGRADPEAWQRLRTQVHHRIKTLTPDRLARLGHAREAVAAGIAAATGLAGAAPTAAAVASGGQTVVRGVAGLLLALCVVALAATYWPGRPAWLGAASGDGPPRRTLPEEPPASRFGIEAGMIAHRDFAVLADPQAAQSEDLAFHSWLAAHAMAGADDASSGSAEGQAGPAAAVAAIHGPDPADAPR